MPLTRRALLLGLTAAGLSNPVLAARGPAAELRAGTAPNGAWRFNGSFPGPLLRARQGEEFMARVYNDLGAGLTVHWHGVRLPNAMDGTSLTQPPIAPGRHFDYVFAPPDAGTFWYRAETEGAELAPNGLFGFFLVRGQGEGAYFDLPLLLDERRRPGASGKQVPLVNGRRRMVLAAPARQRLRLRLLNAGARSFRLALAAAGAWIIAHDGQPSALLPLDDEAFDLWPGQRLDIACEPAPPRIILSDVGSKVPVEIATIVFRRKLSASAPLVPLDANPLPDYFNYAALHHVSFTIEGGQGSALAAARYQGRLLSRRELTGLGQHWVINGHAGLAAEPLFSVPRGTTVAITVDNITRSPHVLHIHGHAARLFEESGRAVPSPVWRDTLVAFPLKPAKILFIADNPGKWLIASAVAEHRRAGLASWFEVL
jgi:FtsP/CotA-like multicopper oxidase with cupredoxin domain